MSKRLKHAANFEEMYMKRKERLTDYKEGKLSEKTKQFLGFPSAIYQNWQAHWTLDDEPEPAPIKKIVIPDAPAPE